MPTSVVKRAHRRAARDLLHTADFTRDTAQCLCSAPRDAHNGAQHAGGHPATGCRKYRRDPAYELALAAQQALTEDHTTVVNAWQAAEYPRPAPRPGGYGVGPSDHTTCHRKIQYRELGLPDGYDPDDVNELAAIIGQLIHDAFLRACAARYPWRDYEMLVPIPGLDRPGRIDSYDAVTGIATDLKTKGENGWERLRENGPTEGEWKQLATYCRGLQARGETPETMEIIAIRRSDGTVERFYRDYDEKYGKAAVAELKAIGANLDLARRGLLDLPRHGHGPTGKNADPICKDYCPFKTACWNLPRAEELGRSPESLAALGEFDDPIGDQDRENIAYAAGLGRDWTDAKNEADKERSKAYTMLVGVPTGEYGDYEVIVRRKRTPLHGKYYAQVQEAIGRGATTDEIATIHLEYSSSEHVEVKKIRAAKRRPTTPHNPERAPT